MTIGSENLSNGSATAQDRFSGGVSAYRQTRRESALSDLSDGTEGELVSRSVSGSGLSSSGLPTRTPIEPTSALDRAAKLPSLDLQGLSEPVFPPSAGSWVDAAPAPSKAEHSLSMADHPLLRGLLLELPARGTMPPSDWLDRWFEAARSILELLYVQEAKRGK
ncbi:hypothetical protein [Symbioplanes lichenis]|uniref:hypothetical protein n=1 Tax=Symbioplanes lichenis TaxID=1629072 RepID=UPI002738E68B|nr:hypothetical protein [Actinoplanes lichenis]